jgi:hypothetical protein
MIRDVDLVSYLPPFMADFKEISVTLEAENPEFRIVWEAADRVLYNEFIATADEYGISRFENILNILPSKEDTLESRRARVQARWFNMIPYTIKALIGKLTALCSDTDFTISKYFDFYRLEIETDLELYGQVEELENIIETMIPCNMVIVSLNNIPCNSQGFSLIAGGVCAIENFFITNDEKTTNVINGTAKFGGGLSEAAAYFITNDSREDVVANGTAIHGAGVINTASVIITNDFNEQFNINGTNEIGSGVVVSEIIGTEQN